VHRTSSLDKPALQPPNFIQREEEENVWKDEEWDEQLSAITQKSMKDRLMAKFGSFALGSQEAVPTFDLRNILSIRLLFIRLQVELPVCVLTSGYWIITDNA